jgi:uncharacterized RDD family membrane protein YckC
MDEKLLLDFEEIKTPQNVKLASMEQRIVAYLIDGIILNGTFYFIRFFAELDANPDLFASMYLMVSVICFILSWLYCTSLESSKFQGTIGKIAMNIQITDLNTNRISFGKANLRFLVKNFLPQLPAYTILLKNVLGKSYIHSSMVYSTNDKILIVSVYFFILAVCIVAFFTENKQALHDIVAKTLVYKKTY